MKIQRIQELTDASIVCGSEKRENDVQCAFASDLMSDVLTLDCGEPFAARKVCLRSPGECGGSARTVSGGCRLAAKRT